MAPVIFEFEGFEVDTDRFELRRDGEPQHVEPQVFDVLRYLVEQRDRVVPKEELLDNVWGDRFVSESALTSRVKAARQAVGDNGRAQRVISTAHGRGYRFVAPVVVHDDAPNSPTRRDIRYARSGSVNVAYEVTGSGPVDIVLIPGFVSHLEIDWENELSAAFLERLGRSGRLIRFDKRGTGLSDRPAGLPDLEARMDDVRAVLDAVGSTRAVLFGYSEGGPMAVLFAATYPARTLGVALYGTYAKRVRTADYPWAPTLEERLEHAAATESEWGIASNLKSMCPHADEEMARWWQRRARAAASPGAVRALIEMTAKIDERSVLDSVRVPTLVVHRRGDQQVTIENGRYIAQHIPGARLVELAGSDHVPWIGADEVLAPIEAFIDELAASQPPGVTDRALATTLFTDIVGSTDLNASLGDARWSALLDRHDDVMCEIVGAWQGRVVKSTGDGVLAVFDMPARAIRAALIAQERLAPLGLRIRAGLHASEIETRGDDVAGLGVAIAARLLTLAQPGEVLVTDSVRELARDSGIDFVDRGPQTLKGVPGLCVVHAVVAREPGVDATPAVVPARRRRTNLPQTGDEFLGRDDDVARVAAAVAQSRLVTLAGPGGVGKTRLAVEFASASELEAWFVDLSGITDKESVARAFLDTFGVSPRRDSPDCDRLMETLEPRAVLLVVDNCEQVVEAVAEIVGRIEAETNGVRVLATSRQALNVTGEQVVVVAPLALPATTASETEQREADAVRMFIERAERAGGVIDDLPSVVALCRRLDGIPLALELAAARMRAFSAAQVLQQLEAGWSVAVERRDHGPSHHLSLDNAIDWSFQLLDTGERNLLLGLSTFRGPFDLAGATAVADCDTLTTADRLAQLVEKSLVQTVASRSGRRFRLLETVRAFVAARIDPAEAEASRARHRAYFADQVELLGAQIPGPDEDTAAAALFDDYEDTAAAFADAAAHDDLATAARLAGGPRLSVTTEGARWARLALRAIDLAGIEHDPEYVSLLASAAWGAVTIGDLVRARTLANAAIGLIGEPARNPRLCWIWPQATGGSFAEGADGCLAGAAYAAQVDDHAGESFLLGTAAIYRLAAGDERVAVEHATRALDLARRVGSRTLQTRAAGALSYALQDIDAAAARRAAEDVLAIASPGDFHLSMPHRVLAILAWRDGDTATAVDHATQAAYLIRDQGDRYVQATSIRQLAVLLGGIDPTGAAELLGIADALVPDARVSARDAAAGTRLRADLLDSLGADAFAAAFERGRRRDTVAMYATVSRALNAMRDVAPSETYASSSVPTSTRRPDAD
jgi:predicted ATPase/class 3 adenylate cyclase/DNA-binding winged helix-turn-helix (wHTH) protein/esterase/lipase